jgi:DNA-binding MarR family transcriptional regulator
MPKPTKPRRRRPAPIENNPIEDVVVASARLGLGLLSLLDKFFEPCGITLLQFNVLRILYVRDVEHAGMPAGSFASRMFTLNPDVPRIIDRLVKLALVERGPSPEDRRVVLVKITQKGIDLIEDITPRLLEHNRKLLGDMPTGDMVKLAELLRRTVEVMLANRALVSSP